MEKDLILCDTNIFISWFNGKPETTEELETIGLQNILIPSVTVMELLQGARNKSEMLLMKKKLKNYNIIHFNADTSRLAVELIEKYKLSHGLLIPDAIIAATALTYNIILFTYNLSDFQYIPGIKLYPHL